MKAIYVFLILFSLFGCYDKQKIDINSKDIVARVNGEPIYLGDVYRRIQATFGEIKKEEIPEDRWRMIFEGAFESELIDKIILMEAKKENISVPPEVVRERVERIKDSMGDDNFKKMLKDRKAREEDFWRFLEEREMIEIYKNKIVGQIDIDEKTLRDYYEGHKKEFIEPEKVRLELIRVTDEAKAEEIFRRWRSGEDFEKLAAEYRSEGNYKSAARLRALPLKELPDDIASHVSKGQQGEILEPIRSGNLIYIIKILEKFPPRDLVFEEVKDEIKRILVSRKEKSKIEEWYLSKLKEVKVEYLMRY
ncbi:MAG: peptidyl-prolyl cis-trans isomerase [Thermodesulfovibrionales bacterium]|nr:peptidyl-prolyl cis-trans isomerase [Thermodesulfovibrionales bacterium]